MRPLGPLSVRAVGPDDRALLDRLVRAEAVVPVRSPRDLARRLAPDRRMLAISADDGEPLAFLHVALAGAFPGSLDAVLSGDPTAGPFTHATFYGITRVSPRARGQAGQLLFAAKDHLLAELPGLTDAATLSPMPGFRDWARRTMEASGQPGSADKLDRLARSCAAGLASPQKLEALERLARLWLQARRPDGRPKDPVARFHLRNGATLRRVLVCADCSWHGLGQSLGVMASYRYVPAAHAGSNAAPLDQVA